MKRLLILCGILPLLVGCVTEDYPSSSTSNSTFEALWRTLDEHYCFFDYKNINWQEVHDRYQPMVQDTMSLDSLHAVLSAMTYELRDGHVNLISSKNVSRYGAWFDDYPMNFSDSLLRKTLGRSEEFRSASGLQYRVLENDSLGYVRVASFDASPSVSVISEMLMYMKDCPALIIDVRSNGGGYLTAAERLMSSFINERTLVGYMQHKTGRGHQDFSAPQEIYVKPSEGVRWLRPVIVLANRRTYSAANSFVMYMEPLPNVMIVGDRTGGGSGMPFNSELPNGWSVRFSASPMLNLKREHTEFGIEPHVKRDISSEDYQKSVDTILETARDILHEFLEKRAEK